MLDLHRTCLEWLVTRVRKAVDGVEGTRIGVIAESGFGDKARALCVATATQDEYRDGHVTAIFPISGSMADYDIAHHAKLSGAAQEVIMTQRLPRPEMLAALRSEFDVIYDAAPIAVGTYWHWQWPLRQVEADLHLAPYRVLYDGYPLDNYRLRYIPVNQWQIMSTTSGLDVRSTDLLAPVECAPWPDESELPPGISHRWMRQFTGSECAERAHVGSNVGKYVAVHAGAGPGACVKVPPMAVYDAIVEHLGKLGYRCVQVGTKRERQIKGCIDKRGYRLPLTNAILKNAAALVAPEGFLAYMAAALNTRSCVLFGPTPIATYGLPQNANIANAEKEVGANMVVTERYGCPMGTCFWGGGWAQAENWATRCPLGTSHPDWDGESPPTRCLNFPLPQDAAARVGENVLKWAKEAGDGRAPVPGGRGAGDPEREPAEQVLAPA